MAGQRARADPLVIAQNWHRMHADAGGLRKTGRLWEGSKGRAVRRMDDSSKGSQAMLTDDGRQFNTEFNTDRVL